MLPHSEELDIELKVGRTFESYEEFKKLLDRRLFQLGERWVIDNGSCRYNIQNKRFDNVQCHFSEKLKYYYLRMRCKHEGTLISRASAVSTGSIKRQKR